MLVKTLSFKDHLDLTDGLEIALEKRIAVLEAENAALRARVQALEAKLENYERVRDLSLTLTVLPVPYPDIRDIVALAFGA